MTLQLFRDDSFGLCPRGFLMQFSSMMAAQAALHSGKHLPLKGLTAKKPAAPQRFARLRVRFLKAPSFHPLLELLPPGRGIFLDSFPTAALLRFTPQLKGALHQLNCYVALLSISARKQYELN